jgi:hypothetical protein
VWEWFVCVRAINPPISGTVVQEHAEEAAKELWKSLFRAPKFLGLGVAG